MEPCAMSVSPFSIIKISLKNQVLNLDLLIDPQTDFLSSKKKKKLKKKKRKMHLAHIAKMPFGAKSVT